MKKLIHVFLCCTLLVSTSVVCLSYKVKAENDFEINERTYIEKCKASDMTKKDTQICDEFNQYLKDKNSASEENAKTMRDDIEEKESTIQDLQDEIDQMQADIESKQIEIDYTTQNINELAIHIEEKETKIKERLYEMQTYLNSNQLFDFIMGASTFSDLFSRIDGINEITSYDKELIRSLAVDKENQNTQKEILVSAQANLNQMNSRLVAKQDELSSSVASLKEQVGYLEENIKLTNESINAVASAVTASQVSIAEQEELQKRLEEEAKNNQNNNNNTNTGGSDNNTNVTPSVPEGSTVGKQAVLLALQHKGSPYVWGGKGQPITESLINGLASYYGWSWYQGLESYYGTGTLAFDCSGLTSWCYAQLGYSIGLSTYVQQNSGYAVSWDTMQVGDLILFDWDGDGQTDHVGMYAGDGLMVHTATPNDGLGVHVVSLTSTNYWRSHCYTIRRIA